jgi:type I restriction enzyme M protein
MDASQYKDYVLTLLFMKYVSDKYAGKSGALEVPAGGSFADMARLKGDKQIGDKINIVISTFAKANDLEGVIDLADFADEDRLGKGKDMQDRLSRLVAIFEGLDFRANRADGDDLLGDAYEYLMRHFATESGKSKGQFYTPAEVSRILARVIGIGPGTRQDQTIYDPTCGSGSLLLKVADEAPRGITIYGQENDNATWALAWMNMILHGQPTADLWKGNSLAAPHFLGPSGGLKTFDFAVANPPFSAKAWSSGLDPAHDEFERFADGIPPAKNGDYAFLLHVIKSLKSAGKAAVILPHGVLFRGHREAGIRRNLVKRGLIKGIIGLPPNLFYGTGIPACVVVIDKQHAQARTGIFVIDASKGFAKDGNKNRLREQDIHRIVDVFNRQLEAPGYSRMVPVAEIADPANDYNLNLPRYIDATDPEDLHDLDAHLRGGIPNRDVDALAPYWRVFPSLRAKLFAAGDRPGYRRARVETDEVKATILAHPEFRAFSDRVAGISAQWQAAHRPLLERLRQGSLPREVIVTLSEDLLARFADLPLLSAYDVYQRLMEYWAEVMQDDVYLIAAEGWTGAARPRAVIDDQIRKIKEDPDLVVQRKKYKMDLVPPPLIVARSFAAEQAAVDALVEKREAAARELEDFVEENSGEDGLLEDAKNEKGKFTRASVKELFAAFENEPDSEEERATLSHCLLLIEEEASAGRLVKNAQATLDARILAKYGKLTESDIRALVISDKWFAALRSALAGEVQRLTEALAYRVQELEERYAATLSDTVEAVNACAIKVQARLKDMGLVSL